MEWMKGGVCRWRGYRDGCWIRDGVGKEGMRGVRGHQETGDNRTLWAAERLMDHGLTPEDADESSRLS